MVIVAMDPGSSHSAVVVYDLAARRVLSKDKLENDIALQRLGDLGRSHAEHLAIEMAESFGAKVWSQVFTTVLWTGRFVQAWARPFTLVTRREVKNTLTGSARAKDGQIRNVLIDRWGGKDAAIGSRKSPGPLHGITADCWQALAIAVTFADHRQESRAA